MIAPATDAPAHAVEKLFRSFRRVSPVEAATLKPRHIRTVIVRPGQTAAQLWKAMASEHPRELFLMLNDAGSDQTVRAGERVKLVTNGP